MKRPDDQQPTIDDKRALVLACGWQPTIYGTFLRPGSPWHSQPWRLDAAYRRVAALDR